MKRFEHLSVLIECSSGIVPTVKKVKEYIDILSKMGYDKLYLGMADAYKIEEEPFFNYKRGGYSTEELKEMDSYAKAHNIELIAQIHTLSHLHFLRKYPEYWDLFDTDNVLMVGDERVYTLIDRMVKAISVGLSTRKIHIGYDEVFNIGTGRYLEKYGVADKKELLLRHLKRVLAILKKYGYTCELWGDMLVEKNNTVVTAKEVRECLPDDSLTFAWDYEVYEKDKIETIIDDMQKHSKNVAYAGAVWRYLGYGPNNLYSISRIIPQMKTCYEKGVGHYMITLWSDHSSRCSVDATLPSLFIASEYANGNYDGENNLDKEKFLKLTGVEYDDMMSLDYLDDPLKTNSGMRSSSSFWMMFTDIFLGNFDLYAPKGVEKDYSNLADKYAKLKDGSYGYIFAMSEAVMRVLSIKAPLPAFVRDAYANKDKKELQQAIDEIKKLKNELIKFNDEFIKYFLHDNKAFGVEVYQLYHSGQIMRCDYFVSRINAFIESDEKIEELEDGVLPVNFNPQLTADCSCMCDYKMLISYCMF